MKWFIHASIYVALSINIIAICVIAYWLLWPYQVIANDPTKLIEVFNSSKVVHAGGLLNMRGNTIQLTTGVIVTVNRELRNGVVIQYPETTYITDGKPFLSHQLLTIPEYTPPGDYFMEFISQYHVNPIRDVIIHRRSETFKVIAP